MPTPLAQFAIKKVRAGRRIGSRGNIRDVTSPRARVTKGFTIERLDRFNRRSGEWREALVEDRTAGPAETAVARIDWAAWLRSLSRRQRTIASVLATGETTGVAARGSDSAQLGSARCGSGSERVGSGFTAIRRRWASLAAELPKARVPAGAESIMLGVVDLALPYRREAPNLDARARSGALPFLPAGQVNHHRES